MISTKHNTKFGAQPQVVVGTIMVYQQKKKGIRKLGSKKERNEKMY